MTGIPGLGDGPAGPETDAPRSAQSSGPVGPRYDMAPERPEGPSTFIVVKTDTCPWCVKTIDFLKALHEQRQDFQVAVLNASQDPEAFRRITGHTRRSTVPQIFLDGRFVGGWDELAAAAKRGQLDAYLDGEEWTVAPERRKGKWPWSR